MPVFIELTEQTTNLPIYVNATEISTIEEHSNRITEGCDVQLKNQVILFVKETPQEIFNKINDLMKEVLP